MQPSSFPALAVKEIVLPSHTWAVLKSEQRTLARTVLEAALTFLRPYSEKLSACRQTTVKHSLCVVFQFIYLFSMIL